jgi:hypothetical protein
MKPWFALLSLAVLLLVPAAFADIQTDWAYHSAGSGSRMSDPVPGEDFNFLANGSDQVGDADTITLFLLTARDFAGDMEEQIYVRWWNGTMSHWIMGRRVKTITLDSSRPETRFRNLPGEGTVDLDLWKIEIPAGITQPGENFYAIQLKGFAQGGSEERYLLSKPGGDFSRINNLGQVWSASEEFDGQDWMMSIWQ